ncbi:ArsR/SmtB family transcription factor [Halorussus sp. AFM4]|uniref:ArsR/SmtB family transcription factor n=1 Tax=Halorussus sp. AFM4 TaxID=3421651 RepID=UPI003EB8E3CC
MALLDTDVSVRNVVTTDPERAKALENDVRAKIVDALADRALTVAQLREELADRGEQKAETTVRHHVNVLSEAGIVELARLEEAGGATRKYYRSNTRVYAYDLPDGADEQLADASELVRAELLSLVEELGEEHGDEIAAVAREMRPCEYCDTQHYEEFVVRELIDRALTDLGESGAVDDLL